MGVFPRRQVNITNFNFLFLKLQASHLQYKVSRISKQYSTFSSFYIFFGLFSCRESFRSPVIKFLDINTISRLVGIQKHDVDKSYSVEICAASLGNRIIIEYIFTDLAQAYVQKARFI
jgi:hypothetical protein